MRCARPLLGTFVEIAVAGASTAEMEAAVEAAFAAVATVHRLMSFHDEASDIGRLNRSAFDRPVRRASMDVRGSRHRARFPPAFRRRVRHRHRPGAAGSRLAAAPGRRNVLALRRGEGW
jgi:hypothetical protein